MASLLDLRGRLRAARFSLRPRRELLVWSLFAGGALALELYARRASTALEEIVCVAACATLALQLARRPSVRAALVRLRQRAVEGLRRHRIRFGVDLRPWPVSQARFPRREACALVLLVGLDALLFAGRGALPVDLLELLRGLSGLLVSAVCTVLWGALALGTLSGLMLPMVLLDTHLRERRLAGRHREAVLLWVGGLNALVLLLAGLLLPVWVALLAASASVVSGAWLYLPGDPPLRFAWRRAGSAPAAMPAPLWLFGWRSFHAALYLALVLVAAGSALDGERPTSVSGVLGLAFAWSTAGAGLLLAGRETWYGWRARWHNPARPERPRVVLRGPLTPGQRAVAEGALARAGFDLASEPASTSRARRRPSRRPCVAELRLVELQPDPFAPEAFRWPRPVAVDQLDDPALHRALRRRVELQARRALRKGLEKLFRLARARRTRQGIGHWVAPHLWFVVHMARDGEEELDSIGPPYHELLPRTARHHLFTVLRALDVDLLFVEDGVSFASFRRVLALTFEFYDLFGERRLEERHFLGLPGIRVLLEDLCLDEPLSATPYPEPDYEDLARARVLHVFRDRGGDFEREPLRPRRGRRPRSDVLV